MLLEVIVPRPRKGIAIGELLVQQGVLKMVVLRVSMADSPKGIAIDQFNFTLQTGSTSFEDASATASAAAH